MQASAAQVMTYLEEEANTHTHTHTHTHTPFLLLSFCLTFLA
eukprot:COSAG06_NODE_13500_length_1251_cov_1.172743_2_plen_41_part_01